MPRLLQNNPFTSTSFYQHFRAILNNYPSSRRVTQQIHCQLTANGSLNQRPDTQTTHLFNTLLRCYALGKIPQEAVFLYKQTRLALFTGFDSFTYSFLIKACANSSQEYTGNQFHGIVVRLGFECQVYVSTALLNMYVEFGFLRDARKVFDEMPDRNMVSWNVMITGLVRWGYLNEAIGLFRDMPSPNAVSWTSLIDGFASMKEYNEAYSIFREMISRGGIMPTDVSLLAISKAISGLGDLKNCQLIHAYSEICGFNESCVHVMNCLIDAYAKCGCIESALRLFEGIPTKRRNLVTWTSMIAGLAMHGMAKEATQGLEEMYESGISPNRVTFLSVLNGYSHSGLVQEGVELLQRMVDENLVVPDVKHYGTVVDMLGRAGRLEEAEAIASHIPNCMDSVVVWRTILGACNVHWDGEVAERVAKKLGEIETSYGGDYVLMSNILTDQGKFSEAEKFRALIDERGISKVTGRSSV